MSTPSETELRAEFDALKAELAALHRLLGVSATGSFTRKTNLEIGPPAGGRQLWAVDVRVRQRSLQRRDALLLNRRARRTRTEDSKGYFAKALSFSFPPLSR